MNALRKYGSGLAVLATMLLFLGLPGHLRGQSNRGSVAGVVTDASGAVVPHAQIIARNLQTGAAFTAESTSTGNYILPQLPAGNYNIIFSSKGFKKTTLSNVTVQIGTTTSRNAVLQIGQSAETVTVQGDVPTVQTETSDIGTVVSTQQVLNLPLAEGGVGALRSPENFVFLVPGAVGPGTANGSGGVFESKISGGQNYGTEILLDGVDTERSENGSSFDETAPSVEAIQEFKVLTANIPAEYNRTTGGITSFVLKSGTNQYHGEAYDLLRNTVLDANNWFNNARIAQDPKNPSVLAANKRPVDQSNDFGGTFGGPVRIPHVYNGHDKTFFFLSWEQYRKNVGGNAVDTVPVDAYKNGDFSSLLGGPVMANGAPVINPCTGSPILQGQIFDPSTTRTVNGQECRDPFAGNIVPTSRFSNVAKNTLPYFPKPQNSNLTNNFVFPSTYPLTNTAWSLKADQNFSDTNHLSFTYATRKNSRLTGNPALPNPIDNGNQVQNFTTHDVRIQHDYTFGPTLLNQLVLGYNRTNSYNVAVAASEGKNFDSLLGIQGIPESSPLFPVLGFGDSGITGIGTGTDNVTLDNGLRLNDNVSWTKGNHIMKFGVNWAHQQYSPGNDNNTAGSFYFSRNETAAMPGVQQQTGNGFASFLLGQVDGSNLNFVPNQLRYDSNYLALYAQDDYKIRPNLVLNLGLNWSFETPRNEVKDRISSFDPNLPNPGAGNILGAMAFAGTGTGRIGRRNFAPTYYKDWSPRIGFSWSPDIWGKGKTAVRGGYGIYYGPLIYADFGGRLQDGFAAAPNFNSANGFDPAFSIDSGFPSFPKPPFLDPTLANGQSIEYLAATDSRPAMTQNWNLQVQRELASDLMLSVTYVGIHGQRLHSALRFLNDLNPKYLSLGNLLTQPINSPAAQAAGLTAPYAGFNGNVSQALRPYPQYQTINTDCCLENQGQSTYNAFQVELQRRFRNGLNLLASYTFSKTLTDADSAMPIFATFAGGGSAQNPYNLKGEKSLSNQDIPQAFTVSYLYDLPVGKGKKFLNHGGIVNEVLGGWQVGGVQRYQSGQPLSFGCAQGIPGFDNCIRFNKVSGQSYLSAAARSGQFNPFATGVGPDGNANNSYFNKAAFQDPNPAGGPAPGTAYQFGTMPRLVGDVRSQTFLNEDFSIVKNVPIREQVHMEIKADILNAFNRHIFNRPDTGVTSPTFGQINSLIDGPRAVQFNLKLVF